MKSNAIKKKKYINKLIRALNQENSQKIEKLCNLIIKAWKNNNSIFLCGNGGSAANANHIANDLLCVVGTSSKKGILVESLCSNAAVITCIANDRGYENIFSDQIKAKGKKNDLLICLSGSGNSENIIQALKIAKKKRIDTFSILGFDGGRCKKISNNFINYEVNDMQVSEDIQMIIFNICLKELLKTKI